MTLTRVSVYARIWSQSQLKKQLQLRAKGPRETIEAFTRILAQIVRIDALSLITPNAEGGVHRFYNVTLREEHPDVH